MLLKKLISLFLSVGLLAVILAAGASLVSADESAERPTTTKSEPCYDDDRNETTTKPDTDCNGTVPTPEPVSILLFSAGLAGVGFAARRRLRRTD